MTSAVHLETSFTFVTPNVLKSQRPQINELTFASHAEHHILNDELVAKEMLAISMREMAIAKVPVGALDNFELVEFFWLDVKKAKKAVAELKKLVTFHWLELVWKFERSREQCNGDMFTVETNEAAADVESLIKLRRFLVEGLDAENLRKKKRSILLFHSAEANAPRPE